MYELIQEEIAKPFDEEHYVEYEGGYISKEMVEELKDYHGMTDEDISQMMSDVIENDLGGGDMLNVMT